jgi:hypothetical protein
MARSECREHRPHPGGDSACTPKQYHPVIEIAAGPSGSLMGPSMRVKVLAVDTGLAPIVCVVTHYFELGVGVAVTRFLESRGDRGRRPPTITGGVEVDPTGLR